MSTEQETDRRLDRLEVRIDHLTDSLVKIVRVEEQIVSIVRELDHLEARVEKCERDIDSVATITRNNQGIARFADKLFWIIITGMAGVIVYYIRGA